MRGTNKWPAQMRPPLEHEDWRLGWWEAQVVGWQVLPLLYPPTSSLFTTDTWLLSGIVTYTQASHWLKKQIQTSLLRTELNNMQNIWLSESHDGYTFVIMRGNHAMTSWQRTSHIYLMLRWNSTCNHTLQPLRMFLLLTVKCYMHNKLNKHST